MLAHPVEMQKLLEQWRSVFVSQYSRKAFPSKTEIEDLRYLTDHRPFCSAV